MTDVTLSCQGGLNIRAHRIVLSTFSPYFKAIFESQPFVDTPWTYPVVVMKDYGFLEVKAIIEFVYRGEVSVPRDRLASVLATARALEVSGLADLKAENFGVAATSGAQGVNGTSESSNSSPPVNGNNGFSCAGGGGSLTPSPALPVSGGSKRSLASVSSPNHLHPHSDPSSLFTHHSDTIASELMTKRLRGCLDGNDMSSSSAALSALSSNASPGSESSALHSAALSLSATGLPSLDGVRSLLQQPQRLPSSALNQLVQQHRQQQLLQHLALQTQRSSPTATQGNPVAQRSQHSSSLQHMMQKAPHLNQNQGRERLHAARQLQLQSNSMKQQILQHQLMRSKNLQSSVGFGRQTHPFAQYQQKIRQQIQEKQRNPQPNRHLLPKTFKERVKLETAVLHDEDDEVEVMVKEKDSGDKENGRTPLINDVHEEEEGNEESSDRQVKAEELSGECLDAEEQQLVVREDDENQIQNEDEEDMEQEDEEYEIEIDKDAIFQQQQQLRLQQIQKQQHSYQMQLQLEQEEQEQRLLDYHQTLSQTGNTSEDNENEDNGSGFGFDWQEGFTDDLPYPGQKMGDTGSLIKSHHLQSASINSNTNGGKNSTPLQTPDFLQPRGRKYLPSQTNDPNSRTLVAYSCAAGRPRKGNKAQEISPCPECNKVFVRPDVLKLHYRSVHLNERHPCNLCPKIFKWPGDLSKHKRTKHPDKHPPANQNTSLHVQ